MGKHKKRALVSVQLHEQHLHVGVRSLAAYARSLATPLSLHQHALILREYECTTAHINQHRRPLSAALLTSCIYNIYSLCFFSCR
jgi:hypothetical protein